ncbi:MAG: DUF4375 domain-containing protein [Acidobacteriota bacterium]
MTPSNDSGAAGYWSVLEPYWDRIDIYNGPEEFLATFAAAPTVVQTLFAAHFCESEVSNGGLHQFFMNPTGVLAPEAAAAFRTIGLPETGAILDRAMAYFGTPYPRRQDDRVDRLNARSGNTRAEWDPFVDLDSDFYDSLGPEHQPFYEALDRIASSA